MLSWSKQKSTDRVGTVRMAKEGETKKYLITNRSSIKISTMNIISTNECRWILQLKSIGTDYYIIDLLTMGNTITETNNPMVKDIAGFNNMFKEIYNELVLEIDFDGQLRAVKNPATIRSKWIRIREQMKNMENQQVAAVGDVIRLNDDIFDNDHNLFEVIKATELFELFFIGFYGKSIPGMRRAKRPNKFKGNQFEWNYEFTYANPGQLNNDSPIIDINMQGFVNEYFDKAFIEKTYGKFEFLDYNTLKPQVYSNGKYSLDTETGMIEKAIYNTYEIIDPNQLFSKNEYTIETYL